MKRIFTTLIAIALCTLAASSLAPSMLQGIWQSATLVKDEDEASGVSLALAMYLPEGDADTMHVTIKGYVLLKKEGGAYFNLSTRGTYAIDGDTLTISPVGDYAAEVPDDGMQWADSISDERRLEDVTIFNVVAAGLCRQLNEEPKVPISLIITEPTTDRFTGTLLAPFGSAPTTFYKLL